MVEFRARTEILRERSSRILKYRVSNCVRGPDAVKVPEKDEMRETTECTVVHGGDVNQFYRDYRIS